MEKLIRIVNNKKVLFITTKNIDYIRNSQEIRLLERYALDVDKVYSLKKKNIQRIVDVWSQLSKRRIMKSDVVFVGFEPQFVLPFFGHRFKGKTLVLDFFISVYDTLVSDRKIIKEKTLLAYLCHWLDYKTLQRGDLIVTDTIAHSVFFSEEFDGENKEYETIYLEADQTIYYPRKQLKNAELANKYVVLYFGSILPLQGVEFVLKAVELLMENDNIFFYIIGPIHSKYKKPLGKNVKYIDWLSQEDLAQYIANADLCLAGHFSAEIEKAKRTIPGKAYIYEMMGKKMVLGDCSANHEIFQPDDRHIFVEMGQGEALRDAILESCL